MEPRYVPDYAARRQRLFELRRERRYEEALRLVEELEAEGARTGDLVVDRADVLARLNRPADALEVLESGHGFTLSAYGRVLLAGLLENAGRNDEARLLFDELSRETNLQPSTMTRVARHLRERGEEERALALVRRVAEAAPNPGHARAVADALEKAGQHRDAVEVLRQAVRTWPEDGDLYDHFFLVQLKGLDPEVVVEELEMVLALPARSRSTRLRARLALACRAAGDPERARHLLEEALQDDPRDPFMLAHLGYTLRDLGEQARAVDVLERALELNLRDSAALRTYFAACRESGQGERARNFVVQRTSADRRMGWLWQPYRQAFPPKKSEATGKGRAEAADAPAPAAKRKPSREARRSPSPPPPQEGALPLD